MSNLKIFTDTIFEEVDNLSFFTTKMESEKNSIKKAS